MFLYSRLSRDTFCVLQSSLPVGAPVLRWVEAGSGGPEVSASCQAEGAWFSGWWSPRRGEAAGPRKSRDLEWGMAAGMLSRPVPKLLSWGAAAMRSGLVRREFNYRACQRPEVRAHLGKEHLLSDQMDS